MSNQRYNDGINVRRSVLGDVWVDKAEANKTDFDADFQRYISESVWGTIWNRPGLTKRERSMLTISLLTALGHFEELELHLNATKNTGTNAEDIKEVLMHTAVYAGVPAANRAFKVAKKVLSNLLKENK